MLTIDNIISKLFESFPSFEKRMNYEADDLLPYVVLGEFVLDFQEDFIASKLSLSEVSAFFDFANEMANSSDIEVQNIFVVDICEVFSDREITPKLGKERFNDNGRKLLEKTLNGWK